MAIFILLAFGIVVLICALVFRKKHMRGYQGIMRHNKNVQPLFKERSAVIKHEHLLEAFKTDPVALRQLIELQNNFIDKLIDADAYEIALDELALKYGVKF